MKELREKELELAHFITKNKENIAHEIWMRFLQKLFEDLTKFEQPLGHGTFSDYLESILMHGLGSYKPKNAFSPNITSMCDLHKKDGVIASYAFATRNRTDMLAVDAAKITGRDVISRYAGVNPFFKVWWRRLLLRIMGRLYNIKRGNPSGFPVLLIYDGNNEAECEYRNKNIPSEVNCKTILTSNALRYILVPAEHILVIHELLNKYAICARVLPMELFELQEIFNS